MQCTNLMSELSNSGGEKEVLNICNCGYVVAIACKAFHHRCWHWPHCRVGKQRDEDHRNPDYWQQLCKDPAVFCTIVLLGSGRQKLNKARTCYLWCILFYKSIARGLKRLSESTDAKNPEKTQRTSCLQVKAAKLPLFQACSFFPLQDWSSVCPNSKSTFQDCSLLVTYLFCRNAMMMALIWRGTFCHEIIAVFMILEKNMLRTGRMLAWKPGIGECLQDCRGHTSSWAQRTTSKDSSWEYLVVMCYLVLFTLSKLVFSIVCRQSQRHTKYPTLMQICFTVWVHIMYWVQDLLICQMNFLESWSVPCHWAAGLQMRIGAIGHQKGRRKSKTMMSTGWPRAGLKRR